MPRFFGGGCLGALRAESGIFEDQGAAISEGDFFWPPIRTLVELVGLGVACRPFLVEPVQVRFVVGDPFLDGLPRWLDGLHGVDVEGRRWRARARARAREMDNTLPEAVEAEEEFDFLAADPSAGDFHRPIAARASSPCRHPRIRPTTSRRWSCSRSRPRGAGPTSPRHRHQHGGLEKNRHGRLQNSSSTKTECSCSCSMVTLTPAMSGWSTPPTESALCRFQDRERTLVPGCQRFYRWIRSCCDQKRSFGLKKPTNPGQMELINGSCPLHSL